MGKRKFLFIVCFTCLNSLYAFSQKQDELTKLTKHLTQNAKSDKDKAWRIYSWIKNNINYDWERYENVIAHKDSSIRTAEDVIKLRKGICADYSFLVKEMFSRAGIEALIIKGYVRQSFDDTNKDTFALRHAWNAIKLNNKWQLLDLTWAVKDNNDFYFDTDPYQFLFSHLPYDSSWTLLPYSLTLEQFLKSPILAMSKVKLDYDYIRRIGEINTNVDSITLTLPEIPEYDFTLTTENLDVVSAMYNQLSSNLYSIPIPQKGKYYLVVSQVKRDKTGAGEIEMLFTIKVQYE